MRSKAYWAERAAALEEELQNGAEKLSEETIAEYERAIEAINADIRDTFSAYVAMDIPEGEAVKLLNAAESDKTYAELMQLFEETTDTKRRAEILARVNAQAYGARISRLEGVKSRILAEMTRVANTAVAAHKLFYTRTLQKSYYTNVYNIAKGLNCGIDFSLLPTRAINAALQEPWNGANYSDRIWNHNDRFTEAVQNTVTTGIMAGHSVNRMAAQLEEYVKSEGADGVLYSTTRLVRTETAHFMNTGQKAAYDEIGIKKYRFVAALSERTCETCGGLDGKVFDVADAREGVNYPPIHPNCRCTTVMADAISKTRIARDPETGKNYKVDGDMTFEEWQAGLTPEQKAAMETHVKEVRTKKAKSVDNSVKNDIMNVRGDTVALENQRYGRNKSTLINNSYIDSGEYRRKFDNLTPNAEVNRVLYSKAKEMLKHRSGTLFEDMYWIDGNTGDIIASALNEQNESEVAYSKAVKKAIRDKDNLIAIHTHPHSMPPSAADFNSCYRNNYRQGVIACHDGKILCYTAEGMIDEELYKSYVAKFARKGFDEYEAQINALKAIKRNAIIDFWEVE